jgi:hypothetical protein
MAIDPSTWVRTTPYDGMHRLSLGKLVDAAKLAGTGA